MDTGFLRSLREKENTSRNLQRQAEEILDRNNRIPCKEQCMLLQRAADIESEMASMTIGSERDHHIREKQRLDYTIMSIRKEIEKRMPKPANASAAAPKNANDTEEMTEEEKEIERAARTWRKKEPPKHSFEDVAGMEELKKKLYECIADANAGDLREYMRIPKLNSYFFVGPPGCGKTFISEAFAHELMEKDYDFISILGSDIISKYAGTAEKSVTRLFEEAMKKPCILFIDEVDSLCKSRELEHLPEYAANITTSFLTGFNRIHSEDSNVIFIGATNYPDRVDSAMLDRTEIVRLPLPDKEARRASFEREFMYKDTDENGETVFRPIFTLKKGLSFDLMAEKTWRYNYRDIERLSSALKIALFRDVMELYEDQQMAINALKESKYQLTLEKFEEVMSKFKPSPKESILVNLANWEYKQANVKLSMKEAKAMYDCEDKGAPDPQAAGEQKETSASGDPAEEPVFPLSSEYTVDPVSGIINVQFSINEDRTPKNVKAVVKSSRVELENDGSIYSFTYEPEQDEKELEVIVRDYYGFIGTFVVKIHHPIVDSEDPEN